MLLWQRSLIVFAAMLLTSLVAGLIWRGIFSVDMPSYLSGIVGGGVGGTYLGASEAHASSARVSAW